MVAASEKSPKLGVLVGFDGSAHAINALRWGARAAVLRDTSLTVVSAHLFPFDNYPSHEQMDSMSRQIAEDQLTSAREILSDYPIEQTVSYQTLVDDASGALVQLSADAELVVIGQRGRSKFWSGILGSVASELPAHAECPTVIVYGSEPDTGEEPGSVDLRESYDTRAVYVGVDGSTHARNAALVAAVEAKRLGVELKIVQALPYLTDASSAWSLHAYEDTAQLVHQEVMNALTAEIEVLQQQITGVEMSAQVMRGSPAQAMVECTQWAQLTVLGTRGRGGFSSLLLGSVSRSTLANARGTVMVVPLEQK
ncbi:MAG TPA: universal stress protein [Candidatus Yaniella excrementigallinarum]|nr:universal stress protein [Candidatus Yaniella excrementigallinarum]